MCETRKVSEFDDRTDLRHAGLGPKLTNILGPSSPPSSLPSQKMSTARFRFRSRAHGACRLPTIPANSRLHSRRGFEDLVLHLKTSGIDAILENDGERLYIQIQQTMSSCEVWMDNSRLVAMGENIELVLSTLVPLVTSILREEGHQRSVVEWDTPQR